ncbi:Glutathione transport system permease protein GsiC [Corynebacterium ciconiae DSM 44920]|uniref:ABC transporter permease n=1 Tax=Corynebacterium ciconiae TaxID=227319 RepID=UPI0003817165|nr:ABC transporter permease [Corynebacterium ciconiae]WKD60647.1 Glutathione transport system permease protein GsiC [Corynebacterium ciconiae DSM 44920]
MPRLLARAAARFTLTALVASVVIFVLLRLIPGDPAAIALGVNATDDLIRQKQAELGTDRPLIAQYATWMGGLLSGHWGVSMQSGEDITPIVWDRLQVSLILMGTSMALALAIAVPLGMWAAIRRHRPDGVAITAMSQVGVALPSFLAGILLVSVVSVRWGVLPANGWVPPGADPTGFIARLILPTLALASVQAAIMTRYVRSAVLDVLHQDFMRTALAKGMTVWQAMRAHGLRNAALPVVTVTGLQMAALIVGAVVIERVFVLPGVGSYLLDAVTGRDLTAVQSVVMLLVLIVLLTTLLVDVSYSLLDPRLRAGH